MFQLIVEDFIKTERKGNKYSAYGHIRHGGEYNWAFIETLKELFDG